MKPVLLSLSALALTAVAACNSGQEQSANSSAPQPVNEAVSTQNGAAPAGQQVAMLSPQEAYGVRHERFEEIGDSMKAISRELKGGSPEVATVQRHAARIAELSPQVAGWFPAGSGPNTNPRTRVKAEIFSDEPGMREASQRFVEASQAFDTAARSGDVSAIKAALPALGQSCSNCHDKYRGPERR